MWVCSVSAPIVLSDPLSYIDGFGFHFEFGLGASQSRGAPKMVGFLFWFPLKRPTGSPNSIFCGHLLENRQAPFRQVWNASDDWWIRTKGPLF